MFPVFSLLGHIHLPEHTVNLGFDGEDQGALPVLLPYCIDSFQYLQGLQFSSSVGTDYVFCGFF